jgi:hypothetical protein
MKSLKIALAAGLLAIASPAAAGPYLGVDGAFQSVSLDTATANRVPHDLTGIALDTGWQFGPVALGGQFASTSANQNGNSLSDTRYAITASYHVTLIPGIDTFAQIDGGRSAYSAIAVNNFPQPASLLFHGSSNDWGAGLGSSVSIWGPLAIRADGGYRSTNFAGHASGGFVLGVGLVLAR